LNSTCSVRRFHTRMLPDSADTMYLSAGHGLLCHARQVRWAQNACEKLSLCLIKHYAMKTYGGSGGIAPPFSTSALDGGEWSASRPGRFIPGEIAPSTLWIGGWVDPTVGIDDVEKREMLPCRESNSGHPARSPSL
jgi:hypothetical protein